VDKLYPSPMDNFLSHVYILVLCHMWLHILIVNLVANGHVTYVYATTHFSSKNKSQNNHATLYGWKVGVSHILMWLSFWLGAALFFCNINSMQLVQGD